MQCSHMESRDSPYRIVVYDEFVKQTSHRNRDHLCNNRREQHVEQPAKKQMKITDKKEWRTFSMIVIDRAHCLCHNLLRFMSKIFVEIC